MAFSSGGGGAGHDGDDHRAMAEMNVIPLVDVMLVLLIMMMVASPFLEQGVNVELPVAGGQSLPQSQQEEPVILFVSKDQNIRVGSKPVAREDLLVHLQEILKGRQQKELFVRADKDVPYGVVAELMARVQAAGIERVGLVTQSD